MKEEEFADMGLTFTEIGSKSKEVELVEGGKNIPVTK